MIEYINVREKYTVYVTSDTHFLQHNVLQPLLEVVKEQEKKMYDIGDSDSTKQIEKFDYIIGNYNYSLFNAVFKLSNHHADELPIELEDKYKLLLLHDKENNSFSFLAFELLFSNTKEHKFPSKSRLYIYMRYLHDSNHAGLLSDALSEYQNNYQYKPESNKLNKDHKIMTSEEIYYNTGEVGLSFAFNKDNVKLNVF